MSKIATNNYINTLLGGEGTENGSKCPTKQYIESNYPNILLSGTYSNNQLVKESDLQIKELPLIYNLENYTITECKQDTMQGFFNASKKFKIEASVVFNALSSTTDTTIFIITTSNLNQACFKANNIGGTGGCRPNRSFWQSADSLGEWHFGNTKQGELVEYTFEYNGDNTEPTFQSNLPLYCVCYKELTPRDLNGNTIQLGKDFRNSRNPCVAGNHINYLRIYCEQ